MAITLSQAQYNTLQAVINDYVLGTAPENQLHDTEVNSLAGVMAAVGFQTDSGTAAQALRDRPLTTLVAFAAFVGHP